MRMMDELKHMMLYSANKKVCAPIDEKDRRRNSAILLLTPGMEVSSQLMRLPYIYNPNLFTSFYIDRNVMAYIDNVGIENIEFDEKEEEALSEAMKRGWTSKVKFKFDDHTSIMDKKYIEAVFNSKAAMYYARRLNLHSMPEEIKVFVYPNLSTLQKNAPKGYVNAYKDKLYSYSINDQIHLVSKLSYDPDLMGGSYELYLTTELIYSLIMQNNEDLPFIPVRGIAMAVSGQLDWINDNDNVYKKTEYDDFGKAISGVLKKNGYDIIARYIRTGDLSLFAKTIARNNIQAARKLIFEAELSYFERQRLLPSDFGIPDKRKYPMPDEEHVRAAVRMFNNCDPSDEEELAAAIIKKMKRFGIDDIKVSAANRFRKYYKPKKTAKNESFVGSDYADIMEICSHLSADELKKITFYDIYRDSPFVIKRIIHRDAGIPVGFLDVYHFPSNPDIAQIVIAVDGRYRGQGISQDMVSELMNSDLHEKHNFKVYYWTAHLDNDASQGLALKNGFTDIGKIDKYGRKIFLKVMKSENIWNEIPGSMKPSSIHEAFVADESSFVTDNLALFTEADDPKYSQKLRRYLYAERIKNNKGVLELYERMKESNPEIRRMYLKIEMYKRQNLFVDLSYYHALFLKNNLYKLDKAVNFYFDFLNRLINNPEIDKEYKKKTIFIPIDPGVWPVQPNSDIFDFRKNLNPISIIFRLVRTNPGALRKAWGNKDIIFVGSRGYFKIDFKQFELKNLSRFKTNLKKLMSFDEPIEDEYEIDPLRPDGNIDDDTMHKKNIDSSKAMAIKMIDRIENNTPIKVDDVSSISNEKPSVDMNAIEAPHMKIMNEPLNIDSSYATADNGIAVISIDPDGPDGFEKLDKTVFSTVAGISTYCMPK